MNRSSSNHVCSLRRDDGALILSMVLTIATSCSGLRCNSDPCMYGICLDDANSSYSCYCIDGYTGINCEINWDDCWSSPCLNGGTCNDAVAAYNCTCPEGFVGVNCEQRFNECLNQPCLNNGTCIDYNGFTCQCPEGYSGEYCEIDASVCNNTICKHSGACIEGPGFSFSCRCSEGWTGKLCEEDIDECVGSPCQNGGLCINVPATYTCACLFGYTGKDCDKVIVPCELNPCQNDAICLLEDAQPICYCIPDYHGSLCELRYNDCESKFARCENGGSCIDGINNFTCACPPQYSGDVCAKYNPLWTTVELLDLYTTEATSSLARTRVYSYGEAASTTATGLVSLFTRYEGTDESSASTLVTRESLYEIEANFTESVGASTNAKDTTTTTTTTTTDGEIEPATFESVGRSTERTHRASYSSVGAETEEEEGGYEVTTSSIDNYTYAEAFTSEDVSTTAFQAARWPASWSTAEEGSTTTAFETRSTTLASSTETAWTEGTSVLAVDRSTTVSSDGVTQRFSGTSAATTYVSSQSFDDHDRSTTTTTTTSLGSPSTSNFEGIASASTFHTSATATTTTAVPRTSTTVSSLNRTTVEPIGTTVTESLYVSTTDGRGTEVTHQTTTEIQSGVRNCTGRQCINATLCHDGFTECDCSSRNDCTSGPSITSAAFNGKSYVRQQFFVNDDGTLRIFVRLKTRSKSGILVHASFDDERYILLYMEVGQLKFQFSCGLQTMLLGELDSPIDNGYNVDVEIRFQYLTEHKIDKCSARLLINDTVAMSGEQIVLSHDNIPRQVLLHLGGLPLAFSHYFPHVTTGFTGCMSLLKVNDAPKHFIRDSMETFQIEECTSFLCLSNPCQHYGTCRETDGQIRCECIAGYVGELCERPVCDNNPCRFGATCVSSPGTGFLCLCPLGMHGLLCEQDIVLAQPSFSGFLSGFSSYMAYELINSIRDNMELKMRFVSHSIEQISLMAYMGQSGGTRRDLSDHFSVTYVRGYLMLTWDLGSGVRRIFTNTPLTAKTRRPYTLRVGRRGKDAWLSVDGFGNVTGRAAGTTTRLDVLPILYIGGHKVRNFETLPHDLPLHAGFLGCIFDIELNLRDTVIPVSKSNPATGRGVGECYRNECTHRSCKNGAVCLNHGPTYSCVCTKDWKGPDCSVPMTICSSSSLQCQKDHQ